MEIRKQIKGKRKERKKKEKEEKKKRKIGAFVASDVEKTKRKIGLLLLILF